MTIDAQRFPTLSKLQAVDAVMDGNTALQAQLRIDYDRITIDQQLALWHSLFVDMMMDQPITEGVKQTAHALFTRLARAS
jgi:hypothetical protein